MVKYKFPDVRRGRVQRKLRSNWGADSYKIRLIYKSIISKIAKSCLNPFNLEFIRALEYLHLSTSEMVSSK